MDRIYGGSFQLARQIFSSEIWIEKPASWKIIWIYILGKVNHKKNGKFDRGEGFFNFSEERRRIGNDITANMIKRFCQYAVAVSMISTRRSTRGMIIKIINYDKYQTLSNFTSTNPSTSQARAKHEPSTPINKYDKNEKNVKNTGNEQVVAVDINKIIELFKPINPSYKQLFSNKTERAALERMIKEHGEEKIINTIELLPRIISKPYAPRITTPYQLEKKLGEAIAFINQEKGRKNSKELTLIQ